MTTPDITVLRLAIFAGLLVLPLGAFVVLRVPLVKDSVIALARMVGQLVLVAFFLEHAFTLNNAAINALWFVAMVAFATVSVIRRSDLGLRRFALPAFGAFFLATAPVILLFEVLVADLGELLDVRFVIVIGGMLLGNSLRGLIVGLGDFYKDLAAHRRRYELRLASGATTFEAVVPHLRRSLRAALAPTVASMATMGVVFLPGMMTGQIIGGSSPLLAIKYQIAIMLAIYASTTFAIILGLLFTLRSSLDEWGRLRDDCFRTPRKHGSTR